MRSGVGAFCEGSRREWRDLLLDFFFFDDAAVECREALEPEAFELEEPADALEADC